MFSQILQLNLCKVFIRSLHSHILYVYTYIFTHIGTKNWFCLNHLKIPHVWKLENPEDCFVSVCLKRLCRCHLTKCIWYLLCYRVSLNFTKFVLLSSITTPLKSYWGQENTRCILSVITLKKKRPWISVQPLSTVFMKYLFSRQKYDSFF